MQEGRPLSGTKNTGQAFATPYPPHQVKPMICVIPWQDSGRSQLASHMVLSKFIGTSHKGSNSEYEKGNHKRVKSPKFIFLNSEPLMYLFPDDRLNILTPNITGDNTEVNDVCTHVTYCFLVQWAHFEKCSPELCLHCRYREGKRTGNKQLQLLVQIRVRNVMLYWLTSKDKMSTNEKRLPHHAFTICNSANERKTIPVICRKVLKQTLNKPWQ